MVIQYSVDVVIRYMYVKHNVLQLPYVYSILLPYFCTTKVTCINVVVLYGSTKVLPKVWKYESTNVLVQYTCTVLPEVLPYFHILARAYHRAGYVYNVVQYTYT